MHEAACMQDTKRLLGLRLDKTAEAGVFQDRRAVDGDRMHILHDDHRDARHDFAIEQDLRCEGGIVRREVRVRLQAVGVYELDIDPLVQ